MYRIEQAIQRSKVNGGELEDEQAALNLQHLLSSTSEILPRSNMSQENSPNTQIRTQSPLLHDHTPISQQHHATPRSESPGFSGHRVRDNSYALDDAENPLQLLASASDMPASSPQFQPLNTRIIDSGSLYPTKEDGDEDLRAFFGPFSSHLDVCEDIDPIDMGYITPSETTALFNL